MTIPKKQWISLLLAVLLFLSIGASEANAFGKGASGPDVYAVQGMLKSLGYYAGTIDGKFGPMMESGVKQFQHAYGLTVTGAVNDQTLQSILWAYGNLKIPKQQTPPPAPPGKQGAPSLSAEEQQMVDLVNAARSKSGLSPLKVNVQLAHVARVKSQDMVDKNYFSHQSPTYGSPFEMMQAFGIHFRSAAENIACNQNVSAAHQALMNSQGHRENILNPSFSEIGIGIVNGGMCGKMFTQQFIGN